LEENVTETGASSPMCRLCGGEVRKQFELMVLDRHQVGYFVCIQCGSLQSEYPFWLPEAYELNLSHLDVGAVQRCLSNACAVVAISRLTRCKNIVDFGGGDGLLCRLLRDYGLNCFVDDKFATPTYAQSFTQPDFLRPDILVAFEVIEHFARPTTELSGLFDTKAEIVMVTTELYSQQHADWWYLTPSSGQHVFFYSRQALLRVAERFGYDVAIFNKYVVFYRPNRIAPYVIALLKVLFARVPLRFARAILLAGPSMGVARDFELLKR
jgi:hypothetical protein